MVLLVRAADRASRARASDLSDALQISRSYLFFESPGRQTFVGLWWLLLPILALSQILAPRAGKLIRDLPPWAFSVGYGIAVATALLFVRFEATPFIYFQF